MISELNIFLRIIKDGGEISALMLLKLLLISTVPVFSLPRISNVKPYCVGSAQPVVE